MINTCDYWWFSGFAQFEYQLQPVLLTTQYYIQHLSHYHQHILIKFHLASILGFNTLTSHYIPIYIPCPESPEQGNNLYSLFMVSSFIISATYLGLHAPFKSLLFAKKRQGIVDGIYLFQRRSYNQLLATFIRILSDESMTNIIPSILLAVQVAFDCQSPRYFDYPDMSNTSKSTPCRVNVDFLKPMVGVISVASESGSIIRDSIVVLPLLSSPTSRSFPYEFPIMYGSLQFLILIYYATIPYLLHTTISSIIHLFSIKYICFDKFCPSIYNRQHYIQLVYSNSFIILSHQQQQLRMIPQAKQSNISNSAAIKKNYKQILAESLALLFDQFKHEDKVIFLCGYFASEIGLHLERKNIQFLKEMINNLSTGVTNWFISETNFIQILVEAAFYVKQFKNLQDQGLKTKLEHKINDLVAEVSCNRKYLKQKWFRQAKSLSYIDDNRNSQIMVEEDKESMNLIRMIQQQENKKLEERKQKEKEAQQKFKEFLERQRKQRQMQQNKKIHCEICLEEIPYTDIGTLSCGHIFHKSCIRGHIQALVLSKKVDVPCPSGCGKNLLLEDIEQYIDGDLKQKFDKFCFDLYVQKNDKFISWCPSPGCTAAFSFEEGLDNYRCPVCHKHYCLNCRCQYHRNMTCAQYRISNSYGEDDKKFEDFVRGAKFKQCPKCKYWVERVEGCSTMTCRCGHEFCYDCGGSDCPHGACKNLGRKGGFGFRPPRRR